MLAGLVSGRRIEICICPLSNALLALLPLLLCRGLLPERLYDSALCLRNALLPAVSNAGLVLCPLCEAADSRTCCCIISGSGPKSSRTCTESVMSARTVGTSINLGNMSSCCCSICANGSMCNTPSSAAMTFLTYWAKTPRMGVRSFSLSQP